MPVFRGLRSKDQGPTAAADTGHERKTWEEGRSICLVAAATKSKLFRR